MTPKQYKELLRSQQGETNAVLMYKRLYRLIAKGEYDAAVGYEHLIADFPEVESVKNDEKRHGDIVSALLD